MSTTISQTTVDRTGAAPLAGRVAVVTGASSGIGAASAELLAAGGASVALLARRAERLDELAARIADADGTVLALAVDVTDEAVLEAAARRIEEELGRVDLVLNNAGVMLPSPIEERRSADWDRMIDLNVTAATRAAGAFVPQLVAAAANGGPADLINTSSVAAHGLFEKFAVYSGTKAYMTHFSNTLREELGPKGVRVTALEPGIVATELQGHVDDEGVEEWLSQAFQSMTVLTADDVARVVAFIAAQPPHVNVPQVSVMPTQQVG